MSAKPWGTVLSGDETAVAQSYARWAEQPVDQDCAGAYAPPPPAATTLRDRVAFTGPGTFFGRAQRTLVLRPSRESGWWFRRRDLPESMPIGVSVNNVWTTARNIVLCSGSPHNYMRMVEHIIALKTGMTLDNAVVSLESGDPPLFERSSLEMVEGVERVGMVPTGGAAQTFTVKEPATVGGRKGSFLTFLPAEDGSRRLRIDCAVDFRSAIGRQRIVFDVTPDTFRHGAFARTNTTLGKMIYSRTVGKIFADVRNLGYTTRNILIAGPRRYFNEPRLPHKGKPLEAVWHRATLDLLAAVALIDRGRFAGTIVSYKAGHALDVEMVRQLYQRDLLAEMR
ncbi:MAG: UDP-3-O-acyl-N-acetylglucosamine deacetylase [Lentisphaerae bacterium]|nr:UDP-3-O-acyl-N-acetylglucosamine deacetylase [Lentisphaerota bacterium]